MSPSTLSLRDQCSGGRLSAQTRRQNDERGDKHHGLMSVSAFTLLFRILQAFFEEWLNPCRQTGSLGPPASASSAQLRSGAISALVTLMGAIEHLSICPGMDSGRIFQRRLVTLPVRNMGSLGFTVAPRV